MSGVLVWSERDGLAAELLAFATSHAELLGPSYAAVFGESAQARAEGHRGSGADRVYHSEAVQPSDENAAGALAGLVDHLQAEVVLLGATRRGRAIAPRLAQMLGAGCVSEVVELAVEEGQLITSRYSLGGNTLARERITSPRKVIAAVPGAAHGDEQAEGGAAQAKAPGSGDTGGKAAGEPPTAELLPLPIEPTKSRAQVIRVDPKPPADADIGSSDRLVCVGRGLASADDLPLAQDLAQALDAELACTRPLSYEYGWLPEERMIGISGLRTSPRLMLSLGVSGQVQHTVGITGSKVIVAVNQDASAPIFKLADYGIVGDLYQLAPLLAEQLRRRMGAA